MNHTSRYYPTLNKTIASCGLTLIEDQNPSDKHCPDCVDWDSKVIVAHRKLKEKGILR